MRGELDTLKTHLSRFLKSGPPEGPPELSKAGTDVFVAGSSIFGSADYGKTIATFRERIIREDNYKIEV